MDENASKDRWKQAIWEYVVADVPCPWKGCHARRVKLHGSSNTRLVAVCERGHRTSPFAGTFLFGSRLSLRKWLQVIRCYAKHQECGNCVSPTHLLEDRGIPRSTGYRVIRQLEKMAAAEDGEDGEVFERLDVMSREKHLWVKPCKGKAVDETALKTKELSSRDTSELRRESRNKPKRGPTGHHITIDRLPGLYAQETGIVWSVATHRKRLNWFNKSIRALSTPNKKGVPYILAGNLPAYIWFSEQKRKLKPDTHVTMRKLPEWYARITGRDWCTTTHRRRLDRFNEMHGRETPKSGASGCRYILFQDLRDYITFCRIPHYRT